MSACLKPREKEREQILDRINHHRPNPADTMEKLGWALHCGSLPQSSYGTRRGAPICIHLSPFRRVSPCCGRDADANCTECQPYLWDCWCYTNPLYPEVQRFVMSDTLTKKRLQRAKEGYVTAITTNSSVSTTTSCLDAFARSEIYGLSDCSIHLSEA